jgi:hypothetical protein
MALFLVDSQKQALIWERKQHTPGESFLSLLSSILLSSFYPASSFEQAFTLSTGGTSSICSSQLQLIW